jgi:hypothetical protein
VSSLVIPFALPPFSSEYCLSFDILTLLILRVTRRKFLICHLLILHLCIRYYK